MAFLTGTIADYFKSKDQQDALDKKQKATVQANKRDYRLWQESRGARTKDGDPGHAVLPIYTGGFEEQLSRDLQDVWNMEIPTPQDFQDRFAGYDPLRESAKRTVEGIWDGSVEQNLRENFAPVAEARRSYSRSTALDALNRTLGDITAKQARRGFTGDSFSGNMLRFQAAKQAGDAEALAGLQNAQDLRGIMDRSRVDLPLANVQLPYALALADMQAEKIPYEQYLDLIMSRLQPLNFMRIGQGAPPGTRVRPHEVVPSFGTILAENANETVDTVIDLATSYFTGGMGGMGGGGGSMPQGNPATGAGSTTFYGKDDYGFSTVNPNWGG